MGFNIQKARGGGHTEAELFDYLTSQFPNFNAQKALEAGRTKAEINDYLARKSAAYTENPNSSGGGDWKRTAAQILGGSMGGVVGAGSPMPGGAVVGTGLGSSMAGQVYDNVNEWLGNKEPEPLGQRMLGAAEDAVADMVGTAATDKLVTGAKNAFKGALKPRTTNKARDFGVDPPAAVASGRKSFMIAQNALSDFPFSADVLQKHAKMNMEQLQAASRHLASEYGDILSKEELGLLLKNHSKKGIDNLKGVYDKLFSRVSADMGDKLFQLDNLKAYRAKVIAQSEKGPSTKVVNKIDEILAKSDVRASDPLERSMGQRDIGLPFWAMKKHRTKIGEMLSEPGMITHNNIANQDLKGVYKALSQDMEAAAKSAGDKTYAKWKAANKYYDVSLQRKVPILEEIIKQGYDEKVYNIVMKPSEYKDGGSRLRALRRQLDPEVWDTVAATVLDKIGKAVPSAQDSTGSVFSVETFMTNWSKMSREAKHALFSGTRNKALANELDEFTKVTSDFKEIEKIANKSKTGSVLMFFSLFTNIGTATWAGGPMAGAGMAATMTAVPRSLAKLMTSKKFVRWMGNGVEKAKSNPNSMPVHLGRLFVLREKDDPEVRKYYDQIINQLTYGGD